MDGFLILRDRIIAMKDRQSIEEIQKYLPLYKNSEKYMQLLGDIDSLIK
jgi:hypothetical protein